MKKQRTINRSITQINSYITPNVLEVTYNASDVIYIDIIASNKYGVKLLSVDPNNSSVKCKVLIRFLTNQKMMLTLNTLTLNFRKMITLNT